VADWDMVCLPAAQQVQLFAIAVHSQTVDDPAVLLPISCHFRDCKAVLGFM